MKNYRSIICILLALAMVLTFCACSKDTGKTTESPGTAPASKAPASSAPTQSEKPTEETEAPPEEEKSEVVYNSMHLIFSMDELNNRPKEIQPGTVLNYHASNDVPSQLPWNCPSEGWLWSQVYEGLLTAYLGDVQDIRGCIAESWEHTDDFLTWTFKIRDGVKFHDGTACDAPAIVRAWKYTQQASPAYITNNNITSWEATDANTLVIKLSAPCPYLLQALAGNPLMPVSPTALDLYGIGDNRAAIGTGPYYIESATSGVGIVLKAFPDYYLDEKMPCIETINLQVINDQNTVTMAIHNGDIDAARLSSVEQFYNVRDGGFEGTIVNTVGGPNPLWLNPKKAPVMQAIEVRTALDRYLDYDAINNLIADGLGIVQDSIWPVGTPSYVPYDQYYYNPAEGDELLASIGLKPKDLVFDVVAPDFAKDDFVAIQDQLKKAGVVISVEIIEAEANFTYLRNGDWTIQVGSNGYSSTGPYIPWGYILKEGCMIKQCWQDVYDPELYQTMLDEYDKMSTSPTWDQMITHAKQITTYMQEDMAALAGYQKPGFVIFSKEFKGVVFTSDNIYLQAYYLYT